MRGLDVWMVGARLTATWIAVMAVACLGPPEQELVSECPLSNGACPACLSDEDCVVVSNECSDVAFCTHADRDPSLAVTAIGCNRPNEVPPDEDCLCLRGGCARR